MTISLFVLPSAVPLLRPRPCLTPARTRRSVRDTPVTATATPRKSHIHVDAASARDSLRLAALTRRKRKIDAELASVDTQLSQIHRRAADRALQPTATRRRVNAWTQWGALREIVVGVADNACFIPHTPAAHPAPNPEGGSGASGSAQGAGSVIATEVPWPKGPKKQATIDAANKQLDNLANVLEGRGIRVLRPDREMDFSTPLKTPFFDVEHQFCSTCGRDCVITLGNIVLEAAMSRRDRYFEVFAFRDIINDLRRIDADMLWKAAPRPSLRDEMYDGEWWTWSDAERKERKLELRYNVREDEPVFDAADITRCGKDVFVKLSMTCNNAGVDWLRRELKPHGLRVHRLRVPDDPFPAHVDCTFVPLRPGLAMTNPVRPVMEEDLEVFRRNGWRFIEAPEPVNAVRPWASQASKWLAMNVLVIAPDVVVVEEEETGLQAMLEKEGFEVVPVPFRDVYEFGGGLHCATWDVERDDSMEDFFPIQ